MELKFCMKITRLAMYHEIYEGVKGRNKKRIFGILFFVMQYFYLHLFYIPKDSMCSADRTRGKE